MQTADHVSLPSKYEQGTTRVDIRVRSGPGDIGSVEAAKQTTANTLLLGDLSITSSPLIGAQPIEPPQEGHRNVSSSSWDHGAGWVIQTKTQILTPWAKKGPQPRTRKPQSLCVQQYGSAATAFPITLIVNQKLPKHFRTPLWPKSAHSREYS